MLYESVSHYVVELLDHWTVKNRWNLHGLRRVKGLKNDINIKQPQQEDLEADAKKSAAFISAKPEARTWAAIVLFFKTGKVLADATETWVPRAASKSMRGMLMSFLAPTLSIESINSVTHQEIQQAIQLNFKDKEDLLERKIKLTRLLNRYINKRSHMWFKGHGIARAFELTEIINKCQNNEAIDNELVKFMQRGEIATVDNSFWNFNRASGNHSNSLRGELAIFFLMSEDQRNLSLTGSPAPFASHPPAQVAPAATAPTLAPPTEQELKERDEFLKQLPVLSKDEIATKLKLSHYNAATLVEDEYDAGLFCRPRLG